MVQRIRGHRHPPQCYICLHGVSTVLWTPSGALPHFSVVWSHPNTLSFSLSPLLPAVDICSLPDATQLSWTLGPNTPPCPALTALCSLPRPASADPQASHLQRHSPLPPAAGGVSAPQPHSGGLRHVDGAGHTPRDSCSSSSGLLPYPGSSSSSHNYWDPRC